MPSKTPEICLVANSQRLVGAGYGAAIDAHEYVCRFNDFEITQAQRADFGERTTHHWCCQDKVHAFGRYDSGQAVREVVCAPHRFDPGLSTLQPGFVQSVADLLPEGRHASTGLVALMYYRSRGFKITLANFDFYKTTHYFGRWGDYDQNGVDHFHAPGVEQQIVEQLREKGEIRWI